jgi:hypothetical protein
VSFDPNRVWDSPIAITHVLFYFFVGAVVLVAWAWLTTRRPLAGQILGYVLLALALVVYVALMTSVPNWGIDWHPENGRRNAGNPVADRVTVYGLVVLSLTGGTLLRLKWRRRA